MGLFHPINPFCLDSGLNDNCDGRRPSTKGALTCQPRASPWVTFETVPALKGRHTIRIPSFAPSGLAFGIGTMPRALPWADIGRAFGPER